MKGLLCAGTVMLAATLTGAAQAQVHDNDIEARLSHIVGDWTIEGQEQTYRERCEWYGQRAFVVCNSEDSTDGSRSVSILGYSRASRQFTYHNYNSRGTSRSEAGFPHSESGIVYTDTRTIAASETRTQTTLTPQSDGRLNFRLEQSINGGPWEVVADFDYVPRQSRMRHR